MEEQRLGELFSRIGQGNTSAEQEVYGALHGRVRALASRRGIRGPDLDDLVQDVFTALIQQLRLGRFEARSAPSTWAIAILRHKIADHFRKRGRADALMTTPLDEPHPVLSSSGIDQQMRVEVMQALARLTPTERFVLTSTELRGLTYEEVAAHLGRPSGTVASTKNRAVAKFRDFFRGPRRRELPGGSDGDV